MAEMQYKNEATRVIELMAEDEELFGEGRRNNDMVNMLILAKVADRPHMEVFEYLRSKVKAINDDSVSGIVDACFDEAKKSHMDRILDYVDVWCPSGHEEAGFGKMVQCDYTVGMNY